MLFNDKDNKFAEESIVNTGDTSKIINVMKKAQMGQPITIAYLGGSITEGAVVSEYSKMYASLTTKWWREKFPKSEIKHINAGIGGTGSVLGFHRVNEDVLKHCPDLVFVDFTVNDLFDEENDVKIFYERLLRTIIYSENNPAVMLLFMNKYDGESNESIHKVIGKYYDLPIISYKAALWSEIISGSIKWEDISADLWHPNDCGHSLIAKFLTYHLEQIYNSMNTAENTINILDEQKPSLTNGIYHNPKILFSNNFTPDSFGDWDIFRQTLIFGPGWVSNGGNKPFVFNINASNVGIIYRRYNGGIMGRVDIKIDGKFIKTIDAHIPVGWGEHAFGTMAALNMEPCRHKIEISISEQFNPDSHGKNFMICGILVS